MGTRAGTPELVGAAEVEPVYSTGGAFAPGLTQNLRAAAWLLARSRVDLWHFVFAPNRRSSQVGSLLKKLRRVPVVQTIASPPRSFAEPETLLFGDKVVAQSEWTRSEFLRAWPSYVPAPDIRVIPPPAPRLEAIPDAALVQVRARLNVTEGAPLFVYPGDLEVSRGAERFAELAELSRESWPEARFVFAYRDKSSEADRHAAALKERLGTSTVRFERNVPDIHALVRAATAVVFPVDDLYGKVDLPIVLLEALTLGTPVLALDEGPLAALEGARRAPYDAPVWLAELRAWAENPELRERQAETGRQAVREVFAPERVAGAYEDLYFELLGGA